MSNIKKSLGLRIRELRKSKKLTQEKLAELIGIGTANISYIETGRFAPSVETLAKLSEILGVSPHEIYMFEHLKSVDELRNEIIDALNNNDRLVSEMYKFYMAVK